MDRVLNKQALMGVDEAKRIVAAQYRPERPQRIPLVEAIGLVLAEDVRSPGDFPPFRQSNVDGYAFAYEDWRQSGELAVQREVAEAGVSERLILDRGSAIRIFTGAPVPDGADSVVMQEKVTVEHGRLRMDGQGIEWGANIRAVGSDIRIGQQALSKGTRLLGPAIGLLASLGISEVPVVRRPAVSVILTGSELAVPGSPLRSGQVYESNGIMLRSLLHGLPVTLLEVVRVPDDEQQIREALSRALEAADVVLLTGGASVGDYDFVARAASACGVRSLFHGVRQKPGKPLYYGKKGEIDVFGLPGNPSSVLTCFYVYVLPALCAWAGDGGLPVVERYRLAATYRKPAELTVVLKAQVKGSDVTLLDQQASYQLAAFGKANGLAVLPEGVSEIGPGDGVDVIRISDRAKTSAHTEADPALFVAGPVSESLLGWLMRPRALSPNTGAAVVFQGWVRADSIGDRTVGAIVYTAYREMGERRMALIREELFRSHPITGLTVIHSIGEVRVGECCFFVRVTAPHRKAAFDACQVAVNRVKAELPIWGKELLLDGGAQWKVNKGI